MVTLFIAVLLWVKNKTAYVCSELVAVVFAFICILLNVHVSFVLICLTKP